VITVCFNDGAKAVDQDDFGLVLSAVKGEVVEGTGRHGGAETRGWDSRFD
jgi:hypothetical protein